MWAIETSRNRSELARGILSFSPDLFLSLFCVKWFVCAPDPDTRLRGTNAADPEKAGKEQNCTAKIQVKTEGMAVSCSRIFRATPAVRFFVVGAVSSVVAFLICQSRRRAVLTLRSLVGAATGVRSSGGVD